MMKGAAHDRHTGSLARSALHGYAEPTRRNQTMSNARNVAPDTDILPSYFPIPGFGTLPVNAYVLKAQQPVLIDTGLPMDTDAFVNELESTIDPSELRWLYLTHPDQDHVGSLVRLLDRVPQMRLITT